MHYYTAAKDLWVEAEWSEDTGEQKRCFGAAIRELDTAIAASKGLNKKQLAGCWHLKGLCHKALLDDEQACPAFEKALKYNPKFKGAVRADTYFVPPNPVPTPGSI